jgi:hypothetical protein
VPDGFVTGRSLPAAVEICGLLFRWKPVEEHSFCVSGELLNHVGYCVTIVESEAIELCFGVNADKELDALLATINAEMALAIAPLLLGRAQSHDDASWLRCG